MSFRMLVRLLLLLLLATLICLFCFLMVTALLDVDAVLAEVGQLALHTLEPVAALALLRLALVDPRVVDVVRVGFAYAREDAALIERLDDVRILTCAHFLSL